MTTLSDLSRPAALGAIFISASVLAACSSSSSAQRAPESAAAIPEWSINHGAWKSLGYRWEWTGYPIVGDNAFLTDMIAYDDTIITLASDTSVSALEPSTGKVRWAKSLDRPTTQLFAPDRVGSTLYLPSDTDLYELDLRTGNTLDRDAVGAIINTSPLVMGNLAFMGTTRNELIAFQIDNDFKSWGYDFGGAIQSTPVRVDEDTIAMISAAGDLRLLNTITGSTELSTKIAGGAVTDMLVDPDTIYIPSADQSIYAFALTDGVRYWRKRTSAPITVQPVLDKGVMYATTADDGLVAIDSISGDTLWNNNDIGGWVVSIADDDELIVWTGRELLAVDKDTGELIVGVRLDNVAGVRTDTLHDSDLYVITANGSIAKFSRR